MDITAVFGTVVGGSNPSGGTKINFCLILASKQIVVSMKVYLSGVNPENRIAEILGEMGHEVLVPTEAERGNPNEFTPYSKIREADAVICDMTVVMGIDDHRMAFALGKPILSLRPRKNSGDGLSSFIREVSRVV